VLAKLVSKFAYFERFNASQCQVILTEEQGLTRHVDYDLFAHEKHIIDQL